MAEIEILALFAMLTVQSIEIFSIPVKFFMFKVKMEQITDEEQL